MPKKKTVMETSQTTEVAPAKRSFRTREHLSYPDSKGRSSGLAGELSRNLLPRIREAVLHPPQVAKPIADKIPHSEVSSPQPDASQGKAESSRCRRCREGRYGGNGNCNYCGHNIDRPVRKSY